jgi:hypothetical protein
VTETCELHEGDAIVDVYVLRACASGDLHPSVFGVRVRLVTDRLEPRVVGLVLQSEKRSVDLEPAYVCSCGAFALAGEGAVTVDDLATTTGAVRFIDVVTIGSPSESPLIARVLRCHPCEPVRCHPCRRVDLSPILPDFTRSQCSR